MVSYGRGVVFHPYDLARQTASLSPQNEHECRTLSQWVMTSFHLSYHDVNL